MPYITQDARKKFTQYNLEHIGLECESEGELNYVLTKICIGFLAKKSVIKYSFLNAIIGVLECCKLEFYRKIVSNYEQVKEKENGEIYE